MKIGILAGEASGDALGAHLIEALREKCADIQIEGIGGEGMIAAGCHSLFDIERLSVMGLVEPLKRLPDLFKLRKQVLTHFMQHKPDVFIGIDAPDFNIGLEFKLRKAGIPVVHYVSPSVWAWRRYRIRKIAKAVDLMLTLLPFEAKFYQDHQVPVRYVGHPLAWALPVNADKQAARRALCIDENATYVALLPGSRRQEIRHLGVPMLEAAKLAYQKNPNLKFLTSHINEERYQAFYKQYQHIAPELPLQFFTRHTHDVMTAADYAFVTLGTATLETMLCKTPMVVVYKMPRLTYAIAKWLVKAPFAGLPNLLANERLVPELIQHEVKPEIMCDYFFDYLDHPEKVTQLQARFTELHHQLRKDSSADIAAVVLEMVLR